MRISVQRANQTIYELPASKWTVTSTYRGKPGRAVLEMPNVITVSLGDYVRIEEASPLFYGRIFEIEKNGDTLQVTCFDQLRYLLNEDEFMFQKTPLSHVLLNIANRYGLKMKTPALTKTVTSLIEIDKTALDVIYAQLDPLVCLRDNVGTIEVFDCKQRRYLKELIPIQVTRNESLEDVDTSVIATAKIKEEQRFVSVQSQADIKKYGVLQHVVDYDVQSVAELKQKAGQYLEGARKPKQKLTMTLVGDLSLYAGQFVLYEKKWYLVTQCEHTVEVGRITTEVTLNGGWEND